MNEAWLKKPEASTDKVSSTVDGDWQQLVFHVVDDAGQPVPDYFIDFHVRQGSEWIALSEQETLEPTFIPTMATEAIVVFTSI